MKGKDNEEKKSLGDYGIIFLSGSIDAATAQSVCQEIIRINIEHSADFVQMIVNSVGGHVSAGFAIIDMMEWSRLPVYTTGVGMVASMGLAIFMAGEKGQRVLTPRTSVLSHRFSGMNAGNYSDLIARRKEEDFLHERHTALHGAHIAQDAGGGGKRSPPGCRRLAYPGGGHGVRDCRPDRTQEQNDEGMTIWTI